MRVVVRSGPSAILLTRVASFVAVGVVAGLALVAVPNVELVTAVCFCAGFLLGPAGGLLTGALTEAVFAGLNPLGSSVGLLLVAQMIGMGLVGLSGALVSFLLPENTSRFTLALATTGFGIAATLVFDLLTNLAFPLMAGFSLAQTMAVLALGIPFAATHVGSNALVFLFVVTPLLPRLRRALASP